VWGWGEGPEVPQRVNPPLPSRTLEHARKLPTITTDAEQKLWHHLRASRFNGLKFRRQHPIPPYIVDFYCEAMKLVVELDGSQHNEDVDATRTRFLESRGLKILRYWDNEVLRDTEAVLEAIWNAVDIRTLAPTPLPRGEGL
jgi:very-short-patch-repair endonuclease